MRYFVILLSVFMLLASRTSFAQIPQQDRNKLKAGHPLGLGEDIAGRKHFERMRLANPSTGSIPQGMRMKELKFAAGLPSREDVIVSRGGKSNILSVPQVTWDPRGPQNIGGRTNALGIDVGNENIILAGSTSGGMWRSTDGGSSWVRTTPLDQIDNISDLVQDTRKGKTNTWYCSTGEPLVASVGEPLGYGYYVGNGLFKSTDNGLTWKILPATVSKDSVAFAQPFNWVNRVIIDPTKDSADVVYAATMGGIERSSDGGASWSMTLGQYPNGSELSDIAVTSNGVLYAVLAEAEFQYNTYAPIFGVFRSTDGIHWTKIVRAGWQVHSDRVYIASAPSNGNVMYVATNDVNGNYQFWKYTYKSGDGSGSGGVWEDRTSSLTNAGVQFGGFIHVQPDNENVVYLGEIQLWRSTDGFATVTNVSSLNYYNGQYDLHVDHQAIAFYRSNPSSMIVGCDGGLFYTGDNQANQVSWSSLDNNYVTAQFFTIGVDHYTPGNVTVLGGTQDNGSNITVTNDESQPWNFAGGGDGMACAIAGDRNIYYSSFQQGYTSAYSFDASGVPTGYKRIDPTGGTGYTWQNPFVLDPNNSSMMYLGGGHILWRNNDLSSITLLQTYDTSTTSIGWTSLNSTKLPLNSPYGTYSAITAIGISTNSPSRVYYGTNDGMLFRLDRADTGDSKPTAIWTGKGFPSRAYVSSIAVDPHNADSVIVVFANFQIQSLFLSTDAGLSWKPVGGNLEEYPNGSGNGPSCRAATIVPVAGGNVYLVGTTTGVYSTYKLDGMSTVWSLEGASTIGNDIINALDARPSDGYVAVGSCGSGAFTATFTSGSKSVPCHQAAPSRLSLEPNYPNPYSSLTHFEFKIAQRGTVSFAIYDEKGIIVASLIDKELDPGTYTTQWNSSNLPSGVYIGKLTENGQSVSRPISIVK